MQLWLTRPEHKYFFSLIFITYFKMLFFFSLDTVPWPITEPEVWSISLKTSPVGLDLWVAYTATLRNRKLLERTLCLPKSLYLERFIGWLSAAPPLGNGVSRCDTDFHNKIWCSYTFALNKLFEYQKNLYWAVQVPHMLKMELWPWTELCAFVTRLRSLFKLAI